MSGLDFLDLVLQSSDSFILNAVFQLCFSLIFSVYEVNVQLLPFWSCVSIVLFSLPWLDFFYFFLVWKFQTVFRWKPEGQFLWFLLVFKGFEFVPARSSLFRASDVVRTSQASLKVEHVKTPLLSSSLPIFQQLWSEFSLFF